MTLSVMNQWHQWWMLKINVKWVNAITESMNGTVKMLCGNNIGSRCVVTATEFWPHKGSLVSES